MANRDLDLDARSTWLRTTPGSFERSMPFFCTEQGAFLARDRFLVDRQAAAGYDIVFTLEGRGLVEQGRKKAVLAPGRALIIDCSAPSQRSTCPGSETWHHLWAHVDGTGVTALVQALDLAAVSPVPLEEAVARRHFSLIGEYLAKPGVLAVTEMSRAIHELIADIVSAARAGREAGADAVDAVRALIERDFARNLTLEDMARAADVSNSYLLKLFRTHLGATPYEYLLRQRITEAKRLLAETDARVGEIAGLVGFASESNFSYRFSHMVGMSPRAYRKSCPRADG